MPPAPICAIGRLEPFFETGTEGVVWALLIDGVPGYDALVPLQDGDDLVVYGAGGTVAWKGVVELEHKRRWREYPTNPGHGQQEINGMWVHGFQANLDPEQWAGMFFQRAPAVAGVRRTGPAADSLRLLEKALARLPEDPQGAVALLESRDPALARRVLDGIEHTRNYVWRVAGWPLTPLDSVADKARAWQMVLAASHAMRGLWQPGAGEGMEALAQRWPTAQAFVREGLEAWLAHRLPQDPASPGADRQTPDSQD